MDESTRIKVCTRCGQSLPFGDFYKRPGTTDGLRARCKPCVRAVERERGATDEVRARRRAIYAETAEIRRAATQAWRKANPQRVAASHAAFYARHRERRLQESREYVAANREKQLAAVREWWRNNPEKSAEYSHRRRAQMMRTSVGPVDVEALWTGLCGICEVRLDRELAYPDPLSKSLDHIVPLIKDGGHTQDNLQWVHLLCNMRKGAR